MMKYLSASVVWVFLACAAWAGRPAPVGYWSFDSGDWAVSGSDAKLPVGSGHAASLSLWFNPAGASDQQVLFCYGTTRQGQARGLWFPKGDTLSFFHWGGPDLAVKVGPVKPGKWHHAVGVYDARGEMKLYFNGRLVGVSKAKPDTRHGGRYYIGRSLDGSKQFRGKIDDIAVFAAALDEKDVASLYNKGSGRAAGVAGKIATPSAKGKSSLAPGHIGAHSLKLPAVRPPISRKDIASLGCKEIIFAVRQSDRDGHWYANFGYNVVNPKGRLYYHDGGRLCRLNLSTGKVTTLLNDPKGGVRDPQMHYDGKKILFSYRKGGQPYYRLYEINIDGTGLKQITTGPFDDFEPAYLPDGGIVFCSSRCNRWVPCYVTQVAVLYRCDGGGKNIRQLSPNTEQENTPWVLPDGRILYQRWESVDRSQIGYHHLWTMNPDGTGQMVYFGNMHANTVMIDAKPIPGGSKIVASFSPGHGRNEHSGYVTVVDPRKGPDAKEMARSISGRKQYRDPYPLSEDQFLVAAGDSVQLLGSDGRTTTLFKMPADWRVGRMGVHEPRPMRARKRERIIPQRVDLAKKTGLVMLQDVNIGRNMKGVKPGEITDLLVLEILSKPYNMFSGMEPLTYGGSFLLERIVGTVPVEPDGSAYMELPAMRPLFFVALDKNGMAVKRMQSFMT
ncbi:MAG: hypothetical protein QGG25_17115, partial [Phycisphaerae bacterium]|nr:hypothetical protein [Phycisphaerae bacterium]